ncbi:HlyU family transcriptional regulator [Shimia ponticola]|uniref:HlyU family transcriptional regulator n=1 Tax=Shimia ponticola TaxID=2582893 RepID=UPI0011BEA5DE|nr:HlyU family transcriptional regulator [Shimia ponticola]
MFSKLSKMLGKGSAETQPKEDIVEYEGFRIIAAPISEGNGYRVAARIEKTINGTVKTHQLIRADVISTLEDAETASVLKAKQIIDQQGDQIF